MKTKQMQKLVKTGKYTEINKQFDVKFWHIYLAVCIHIKYGNMGCKVSKEGIKNNFWFWPKINKVL